MKRFNLSFTIKIPIFNNPKKEGLGNKSEKRRKHGQPGFSPFLTNTCILSKLEIIVYKHSI